MNETVIMTETEKFDLLYMLIEALVTENNKLKLYNTKLAWTLNRVVQPLNQNTLTH